MTTFLAAINEVVDLDPKKGYVSHVKGPLKDMFPPVTQKIGFHVWRWMVSLAWLAANPDADMPMVLIDNGKAWGDLKDPEGMILAQKHVKEVKQEVKALARKKAKLEETGGKGKQKVKETMQEAMKNMSAALGLMVMGSSTGPGMAAGKEANSKTT